MRPPPLRFARGSGAGAACRRSCPPGRAGGPPSPRVRWEGGPGLRPSLAPLPRPAPPAPASSPPSPRSAPRPLGPPPPHPLLPLPHPRVRRAATAAHGVRGEGVFEEAGGSANTNGLRPAGSASPRPPGRGERQRLDRPARRLREGLRPLPPHGGLSPPPVAPGTFSPSRRGSGSPEPSCSPAGAPTVNRRYCPCDPWVVERCNV